MHRPSNLRPPVLILGMHRSGTTLLAKLLQTLGWFPGHRLEDNAEAWFFLRRNEWLLRRAGGAWDHPLPVRDLLSQPQLMAELGERFAGDVASRHFREFVGPAGRQVLDGAWGWKDPRNVFTLRAWAGVFPGCRIFVVRRNGVDVARSLVARERARMATGDTVLKVWPLRNRLKAACKPIEFNNQFPASVRCASLQGAFGLWEEYVGEAEAAFEAFDGPKQAIAFEDLLRRPAELLGPIATFFGCTPSAEDRRRAEAMIDGSKAFAFAHEPQVLEFWRNVRESHWMRRLGYDSMPSLS